MPLIGVAVGAGLNARMLQRVTSDAGHIYRERFLREKYSIEAPVPDADDLNRNSDPHGLEIIEIIEIIENELVAEADVLGDSDAESLDPNADDDTVN